MLLCSLNDFFPLNIAAVRHKSCVTHTEVGRGMKTRPTETGDTDESAGEKGKRQGSIRTGAAGWGNV